MKRRYQISRIIQGDLNRNPKKASNREYFIHRKIYLLTLHFKNLDKIRNKLRLTAFSETSILLSAPTRKLFWLNSKPATSGQSLRRLPAELVLNFSRKGKREELADNIFFFTNDEFFSVLVLVSLVAIKNEVKKGRLRCDYVSFWAVW